MTYSVTGIQRTPDVGFRFERRMTALAAKELATSFRADGMREVEIRNRWGTVQSLDELERQIAENGRDEASIAARLAAL